MHTFQCIPAHERCDGFWDCSEFNSSDEKGWDLSTKFHECVYKIRRTPLLGMSLLGTFTKEKE